MFRTTAGHGALALAVACASPAFAEEAEADRTIIVTGATSETVAEREIARTPGGVDVVTHDDYADKSLVSLRDALAFSPGVYLQPRFGQDVRISIRGSELSRGFHMRGLTLLQDGVPINLADDNGDFQELEPSFFDHLEVYRGANALRLGSGTLGGAVNGVTPNGRDAAGLYLRGDAGSFDSYRGLAAFGGASANADYWAAISADSSDGDRIHSARNSLRFHGNAGLNLSDTVETRFYASANHIVQELPGALNFATALASPRSGNTFGDQHRDIDSLRVQNRTTVTLGESTLELAVFLNTKSLFHPIFQVIDQESTDRGAMFRYTWQGSELIEATIGGEWRSGSIASKRFVNAGGQRGAKTFDADQDARTASLYGELRLTPLAGLSLIAGGIYADGWRRQHQTFANGPAEVTARADFNAFSPRLGVLWEPLGGVQVYANYSRSVEFPTFVELAQISAFVPVREQRAWTAELGVRGKSGIAQWDIAAYRADIRGEMLQYSVGLDIPAATFNAGRTRHQGIEAALSLDLMPWLRLRQVYTYSDFRFRGDIQFGNNRLPVIPRHAYRAELRIGTDALHIAPAWNGSPKGPSPITPTRSKRRDMPCSA
jgi:iron complex outermembrane receptor protein